jgi:3-deoxy-D-manno-octulosonic-acid transferase
MPIPGYRFATKLASRLPLGHGKLAQSVAGRRDAVERWENWASIERTDGPLVWVHAASVGEGLAAEPVIRRLRAAIPDIQIVHSFSSPSAANWPGNFGAAVSDYVPPDECETIQRVLEALQPSLVLFSRGDIWPELATQTAARGVPLAVSGAVVRPNSHRLRQPMRTLLRQLHNSISWLGAVSNTDADRYSRLGVRRSVMTVTGDPRHDQILERVPRLEPLRKLLEWLQAANVLVAGSSHPEDEIVVLDAFSTVSQSDPSARLMVVPHDLNPNSIHRVVTSGGRRGIAITSWDGGAAVPQGPCVVVAAVGILADLYAVADIAYIGGGFKRGMLHSVAEPAAYAVPVIVGPHYRSAADAKAFVDQGGASVLPRRPAAAQLSRTWLEWIREPERQIATGLAARKTLRQGAAARTVEGLLPFLYP